MSARDPNTQGRAGTTAGSLLVTWLALMVLAGMSFGLRFAHLGAYGFAAALAIAVVKAALVALIFMELFHESATMRLAFLTGLSLLAILLIFMVADIVTRPLSPIENPPGTERRYVG